MTSDGPDYADLSTTVMELFVAKAKNRYRVRVAKPIQLVAHEDHLIPEIVLVRPKSYRRAHPKSIDIDLLIEFTCHPHSAEMAAKTQAYASARISDYWMINLQDTELTIHRQPEAEGYLSVKSLKQGIITPEAFADIRVSIRSWLHT